jgi:DNA polymerase-4
MAEAIFKDGKMLLVELLASRPREAYRLLGIGVSQITPAEFADIPDLAEPERKKQIDGERAMDRLREKFGPQSIRKGRDLL